MAGSRRPAPGPAAAVQPHQQGVALVGGPLHAICNQVVVVVYAVDGGQLLCHLGSRCPRLERDANDQRLTL